MGALLDVFVHKAKEECMCDLLTIFLHDADKDELIARWATAFPSDFSHDAKAYVRIPQTAGLVGRSFNEGLSGAPPMSFGSRPSEKTCFMSPWTQRLKRGSMSPTAPS